MTNKKVLVVDDDPRNRKLLRTMVEHAEYECLTAEDSNQALVAVGRYRPDLILTDVMMPGMDGYELTRRLKGNLHTQDIPVILVTALNDRASRIKGLDAGAEEFISKPVDHVELAVRMRNLLRIKEYNDFVANHNRLLQSQVQQRTRELCETRLEIVRALGKAAEYRDNETGTHIMRISHSCKLLAEAHGLGGEWSELIFNASPMHDIGKVGIPDSILLKPAKLTPEEWATMQTHTTIGANILESRHPSELVTMARRIALSHHEKWDGSGYPRGLGGNEIPLEARMVALTDVFDALTSKRPYKKAWPVDQAVAELRAQRGRHFEPKLVDLFLELLPDVVEMQECYAD